MSGLQLNPAAINEMLHGAGGPVARDLLRRGEAVRTLARARVRPSAVRTDGGGLRDSVTVLPIGFGTPLLRVRVGSDAPYAAAQDQGARPHVIRPKRAGGLLVFYWPKVGRVVGFPQVNHPGNPATHWLSGSLAAAAG